MNQFIKNLAFTLFIFSNANAQFSSGLSYTDINGEVINPSEILSEGKYIYLDFFSTTCGACNNVANEIVNAYETYGSNNSNVFFLGVEYGSTINACVNFSELHNTNFPIIAGQEGGLEIFSLYNQNSYPSGKLIAPSGNVEANFYYSDIVNLTESLDSYISVENNLNDICGSIDIVSLELNNDISNSLSLNINCNPSSYFVSYPSFYLLNQNGDTLANEEVFYFGLSGESTHTLQITSSPTEWDQDLSLVLFSGFEDALECTFEINLNQIDLSGCSDSSAYNFNIYAQGGNESCEYQSCEELYFNILSSEINLTDNENGYYSLEIPIINNDYYYLTYPISKLQILNDEFNNISCVNCDFNVLNSPWQMLDTNYYNVSFTSIDPSNFDFEAKLYIENLSNDQNTGCVFDESIFFNLVPTISGCLDPEAVNYLDIANQNDGSCLYSSNNYSEIYIDLNSGWNMVGYSCAIENNVTIAMSPYLDILIILKDNLGNAFLPEWDFNGIGEFERGFGYQLKLTEEVSDFNLCNE